MKGIGEGIFDGIRGAVYETWQVAVERSPFWSHPPEERPFRPRCATCFSLERGESKSVFPMGFDDSERGVLTKALQLASREWRSRPARVQVADAGLASLLEEILAGGEEGKEVTVEVCRDLPGVRGAQASFAHELAEEDVALSTPGLLTGEGVALAQIEAFARSAEVFFAAASWQLLGGGDFVRIEAPKEIEPALRHLVVMRLRGGFALSFFRDEAAREAFRRDETLEEQWILFLKPLWEIPLSDADLWQRYGLPLCGEEELCPSPVLIRHGVAWRPDARQLAFFEGLLRALAASTEADMDVGRWEREATTHLGPLRFVFSLPDLLDLAASEEPPLRSSPVLERLVERGRRILSERFGVSEKELAALIASHQPAPGDPDARNPDDPVDRLLDAAEVLGGRRSVLLARRALALRPNSSEAHLVLADASPDSARALELYDRARVLAERDLEIEGVDGLARDYVMRAHEGMALALGALGRLEESVAHLRKLLLLDPEDLLAARERLACKLLELGWDGEVADLVGDALDEGSTGCAYTRVLLAFRQEGDSPTARRALREALRVNALVPSALMPRVKLSPPGSAVYEDDTFDAADYAKLAGVVWRRTPGALTWLAERLGARGSFVRLAPKSEGRGRKKKELRRRPKRHRR